MHCLRKHWFLFTVAALIAAGTAGCSKQARRARHLAQADKYYAADQYAEAEVEYQNALKGGPLNAHAIGRLGLIYFDQGRMAAAYPFLMKARELDTTNLVLRVKTGFLLLAAGQIKEARAEANAILDKNPKDPDAPLLLAETARTVADIQELRQRFETLLKQAGDTAPLNTANGSLLLHAGDTTGAETAFKHAVEVDPRFAPAHFALGLIYLTRNDRTNADTALKAAADLSPRRSIRRLDYADFKLKTGDIEEAKRILTQMTKDVPDYLPAWNALAQLEFAQKNYEKCESLVRQTLARDPDNYDASMLSASLSLARNDVDNAINQLERITTLYNGSAQAHYTLALAYMAKGDGSEAQKNVNAAVTLKTNYDDALLLQAQLNIRRDESAAAVASLTQLIQRRPQLAPAYLLLGSAYSTKGDLDAALRTYRQLGNYYPSNAQVPMLVGAVLQQQGRKDDARRAFERSLELLPGNFGPLEQLVNLDLSDQQFAAAASRIQSEIAKTPQSPQLHSLLAQVFIAQKDLGQAEKTLEKAIALDPAFLPAYLKLAAIYRDTNRNAEALEKLNQVLSRNPKDVSALMFIGIIQNEQRNYPAARAAYEKLLAINPNFSPALNNVAYLYSEQFNLVDKAYDAARRARELSPYDPSTADTLGWVLLKRGDNSRALSLLQESAEKFPDEPDVQFHLGMAYYMSGDEERARKALNRALAINKEFSSKDAAAKRVAMLDIDAKTAGPDAVATLEARLREQPDDPVALSRMAVIYDRQNAPQKAAAAYEQALKQNPKNAQLLIELARLYENRLHDSPKALALAKDAYKLAPDDPQVTHALGRLALDGGDCKWALSLLQQSAQRQRPQPDLLFDLATAYYSVGRVGDAESTTRSALQGDTTFPRAAEAKQFLDLVALPADPAKAAEALPRARQILQTDPANVPALMVVGAASERGNDAAAAGTAYEQALKRYPDFVPAIKRLAILKAATPGEDQRAYDLAVKAREALPDDAELARVLGVVLYRRGDSRSAVRYLTEFNQKGVADADALYYLGMAQYKLKQPKESKESLQRALTLNLAGPLADEARRVLAELK